MGGGGAVLTGVRGCEDGWETLGKRLEKNSGKKAKEKTKTNKTTMNYKQKTN